MNLSGMLTRDVWGQKVIFFKVPEQKPTYVAFSGYYDYTAGLMESGFVMPLMQAIRAEKLSVRDLPLPMKNLPVIDLEDEGLIAFQSTSFNGN